MGFWSNLKTYGFWYAFRRLQPIYWLRTHTINRYHIVDVRGQGDYKWGWCDRDHLMYLACFKILVDFCEKEMPHSHTCYLEGDNWAQAHGELLTIYDWWKRGRAIEHAEVSEMFKKLDPLRWEKVVNSDYSRILPPVDRAAHDAWIKREHELEAKDEEMLARLLKVRGYMWT